ncbi:AarF/ABC1/UbiB kinase family protein [Myxococcota bacterium]|nr:AarF/ABC1/UbiB kinase family protein [Myxococcota bacterium]MBU1432603.1 AarF/ABC1/UbiB kinase family protein [Myxococcota bacterium]MBU1900359.1 AarF/ABC1/UbiB kinase family protein [Myxococcota bacterium]
MLRAAKDFDRLRQIAVILTRHGLSRLAQQLLRGDGGLDPSAFEEARGLSAPERLRLLLQDLGPTFIKLGQVLSSRPDLIPTAYQRELARLQDEVEAIPFEAVRRRLEAAWRAPLETHLDWIDPMALGTASIAQVHRARLVDGREVVVKVKRPHLDGVLRADLDLLHLLARLLDATIKEAALFRPTDMVRAFEEALLDELDFRIEARNARAIAANFAHDPRVCVPATIDHLSNQDALVLDYIEGVKITDVADPALIEGALRTLLDALFQMGFNHGLFHADPHPGNLLVLPDGRLCFLDFGLVGRLTANMQHNLMQLSVAVAMRDAESAARLLYRIGRPTERISLAQFRDEIADLLNRYLARRLDEVDTASLISALLDTTQRFRIRSAPDYALLGKAAVTVEGIIRQLKPDLEIVPTITPYIRRLMADRYSPEAISRLAMRSAVGFLDTAQELPLMAHQLLNDLEAGRISIHIHNEGIDTLNDRLVDLGTRVALGMVASALLLGAVLQGAEGGRLAIWSGGLGGALTLLMIAWHLAQRAGKLSLSRFMRRKRR